MTAAANATFTASEWNTHIRDNLLETAPAKAATVDSYLVSTGANVLVERETDSAFIKRQRKTSSTSYTDLDYDGSGPSVTVTTGTKAVVWISCGMASQSTNSFMASSFEISGATTRAANDDWAVMTDGVTGNFNIYGNPFDQHNRRGICHLAESLTAGSNTFTMKYRVGSSIGHFHSREIVVMPL